MPDRYGDTPDPEPASVPMVDLDARERSARLADAAAAINACGMCDDDGYRGATVCDHQDHRPAYERGMALVREVLAWSHPTPVSGVTTPDVPQTRVCGPQEARETTSQNQPTTPDPSERP